MGRPARKSSSNDAVQQYATGSANFATGAAAPEPKDGDAQIEFLHAEPARPPDHISFQGAQGSSSHGEPSGGATSTWTTHQDSTLAQGSSKDVLMKDLTETLDKYEPQQLQRILKFLTESGESKDALLALSKHRLDPPTQGTLASEDSMAAAAHYPPHRQKHRDPESSVNNPFVSEESYPRRCSSPDRGWAGGDKSGPRRSSLMTNSSDEMDTFDFSSLSLGMEYDDPELLRSAPYAQHPAKQESDTMSHGVLPGHPHGALSHGRPVGSPPAAVSYGLHPGPPSGTASHGLHPGPSSRAVSHGLHSGPPSGTVIHALHPGPSSEAVSHDLPQEGAGQNFRAGHLPVGAPPSNQSFPPPGQPVPPGGQPGPPSGEPSFPMPSSEELIVDKDYWLSKTLPTPDEATAVVENLDLHRIITELVQNYDTLATQASVEDDMAVAFRSYDLYVSTVYHAEVSGVDCDELRHYVRNVYIFSNVRAVC